MFSTLGGTRFPTRFSHYDPSDEGLSDIVNIYVIPFVTVHHGAADATLLQFRFNDMIGMV